MISWPLYYHLVIEFKFREDRTISTNVLSVYHKYQGHITPRILTFKDLHSVVN